MAKNIEKDRVVKSKGTSLSTKENRVVENKPRNKCAGIPITEEEKKECKKVWDEIEQSITYLTMKTTKKESKKGKENTTTNIRKK